MGMFAGAAALYLTGTRVRLVSHQAAEIVLFCLFRYRCLCRDRCRLSVTSSALRYPQEGVTSVTPVAQQCALGSVLHKCVLEQISRVWWHTLPKQQTGFGEAVERRSEKALSRADLPPSTPIAAFVKRLRCRRWRSQSVLAARKAPPEKAS
jgi:hypothetical protein